MFHSTHQSQYSRTALASTHHRIIDTAQYERTVRGRVAAQAQHDHISAHTKENNRLLASNISDDRIDTLRKLKQLQHANAELQQLTAQQHAAADAGHRQQLYEQDQMLVQTVAQLKQQQQSADTRRAAVIESNAELQQLKAQLAAAEMTMVRKNQIAEKQLLQQQIRQKELAVDAELERDRQLAVQLAEQYAAASAADSVIHKQVLEAQISQRLEKQQEQYQMFLAEKRMVDDVVASIAAEDAARQRVAEQRRAELQQEIAQYLVQRQQWRAEERARLEAEMAEIARYQALQQQRQAEMLQAKRDKFAAHDAVLEQLTAEINAKRRQAEEYQSLLDELYQEEMEQRQLAEVRAREQKLLVAQLEMCAANAAQRAAKRQQQARQLEEEQKFRQQMLDKFHEDTRIAAMNAERRRREMIEYKREVEALIAAKRAAAQQQIDYEAMEQQKQAEKYAAEMKIVEAERARLLNEYATKLQAHLPKGVYKSADEYERVTGKTLSGSEIDSIPVVKASNGPRSYIK